MIESTPATEHLPECPCQCSYDCGGPCYCDALRRCELRVSCEYLTPAALALTGMGDPRYAKGYADGLDAAREAVLGAKAIDVAYGRGWDEPAQFIWMNNALAVIDVLRKESDD